ncbi:MAG: ImmA/IrrE family metallo-endopeptidase, partial [Planctomycetota bacterium]
LWLPSLWIQRIGVSTQVASGRIKLLLPVKQVMKTLSDLGNEIAKRIQVLDDARAKSAVSSWRKRDSLSPIQFLGASTGLNRARLDAILEGGEVADVFELRRDLEPNDLTAVARMAGRAPAPAETRKLIDLIRMEEKGDMSRLDALSRKASRALRSQKPFDQGSEIARWFRGEILGIDGGERVDPAAELEKLRVRIKNAELSSHVDAVSIWDKKRGPVVFFNTKGKHSQGNAGPRATLAHELCHMLLDRDGALPFAEVMGGSLPRHIEARARAFAAELLLPKDIAGAAFTEGKDPKTVVRRLREKYAVSKEIVAWQAKNSEQHLGADVEAFLRTLVSYPERF